MVAQWTTTFMEEREHFDAPPSAWLAMNAVTRWADHERSVRSSAKGPADRMFSNVMGSSASMKAEAYSQAMAMTA